MRNNQQRNSRYNIINSYFRKLFFKNRQQPINTEPQSNTQQTAAQEEFNNKTIAEQKRANRINEIANDISRESNRISKTSTIVNSILLLLTVIALIISGKSVIIANKALIQADSSFAEQKRINLENEKIRIADNTTNARRQKYNDSIANLERQVTFASIKSSDSISKATLREQIKQFAVANEPYLNVSLDDVTINEENNRIYFNLSFKNIGNYPVIVNYCFITSILRENRPTFKESYKNGSLIYWPEATGEYITKDMPLIKKVAVTMFPQIPKSLKDKRAFLFLAGEVEFENLVTKRPKKYQFQIRASPYIENMKEVFYNKNIP